MSAVKDAVKLDVITGPGRYEVVETDGSFDRGQIVTVQRSEAGGKCPWVSHDAKIDPVYFSCDGLSAIRANRLARCSESPVSPEQARIASLEAENAALRSAILNHRDTYHGDNFGATLKAMTLMWSLAEKPSADAKAMLRTMEGGG